MKVFRSLIALSGVAVLSGAATSAHALDKLPVLSLEAARKMVAGCEAKAKEMKWKMNVAVVDNGANLIIFERMDGAFLGGSDLARRKAETSAKFPFTTRFVEEISYGRGGKDGLDRKGGPIPGFALAPGLVAFPGGMPIIVGGTHVGGIGVSGGLPDEDELCAKAGLESAKDMLQ